MYRVDDSYTEVVNVRAAQPSLVSQGTKHWIPFPFPNPTPSLISAFRLVMCNVVKNYRCDSRICRKLLVIGVFTSSSVFLCFVPWI